MEQRQFSQAVEQIVRTERAERLVPGDLSRRFGIPVKNVERMLDRMVTDGTLELDSDDDGNLFYFMPGVGAGGVFNPQPAGASPAPAPTGAGGPPPNSWPAGGYAQPPYGAPTQAQPPTQAGWPPGYSQAGPNTGYGTPPGAYPQQPPAYGAPSGYPPQQQAPPGYPQQQPGYPQQQPPPGYPPAYPPPAGNANWTAQRGPAPGYPPQGYAAPPQGYGQPPQAPAGYQQPAYPGQAPPAQYGQPFRPGPPPGSYQQPQYGPGYGPPQPYGQNAMVPVGPATGEIRSPATAAVLSTLFPGAGQLYNGQVGKGLAFFMATMVGVALPPLFVIPYVWSIVDSHNTSRRINSYGMLPP